jgi:G3E family GTPase
LKSLDVNVREVASSCFCCNYQQLDTHLQSLREKDQPDIVFAESVGSCTDLIATIAKPLHITRPEVEIVISVFADVELLASLLEGRSSFIAESVRYIYKKQLEEADLLILNKKDLLSAKQLDEVTEKIKSEYPGKIILIQNSFVAQDISKWLETIKQFNQLTERPSLEIDYDVYGDGEAKLAWLDKSITIHTSNKEALFVANKIMGAAFNIIQSRRLFIGHLKFFVETDEYREKVSFTTTSTSADLKLWDQEANSVRVIINARVETDPDALEKLIDEVLRNAERVYNCTIVNGNWAAFKPGYPRPTHRFS